MSRIKHLNSRQALKQKGTKPQLTLFKGTQKILRQGKYKSPGLDYETFFRLECNDEQNRQTILEAYSSPEEQTEYREIEADLMAKANAKYQEQKLPYSLYLREVRILLAYKDLDRSFTSAKVKRSRKTDVLSGIIHKCNGETIYCKHEPYTDPVGHIRRRIIETNEPCPVAKTEETCPHGCTKEGSLNFYIAELAREEKYDVCSLSLHGYTDLQQIPDYLDRVEENRGDAVSAIGMYDYSHRICYVLRRKPFTINRPLFENKKRTGKTTKDVTHGVTLTIDPQWLQLEKARSQTQRQLDAGYRPSPKLLARAYDLDIVEADYRVVPDLPGTNPDLPLLPAWQISENNIEELRSLWRKYNWTPEGLQNLLKSRFNLEKRDFSLLSQKDFEELKRALKSETARTMFCPKLNDNI